MDLQIGHDVRPEAGHVSVMILLELDEGNTAVPRVQELLLGEIAHQDVDPLVLRRDELRESLTSDELLGLRVEKRDHDVLAVYLPDVLGGPLRHVAADDDHVTRNSLVVH